MKNRTPQFELPCASQAFNLFAERGDDPDRVIKEHFDSAMAAAAGREYEIKMQRVFAQCLSECPGFIGGDMAEVRPAGANTTACRSLGFEGETAQGEQGGQGQSQD